jgi:hypothetical protein
LSTERPSGLPERILELMRKSGEPKTTSDIAKELGESYDNVAKAIRKLEESNQIIRVGTRKGGGRPEILYTSFELMTQAYLADEFDLLRLDERSAEIFREKPPTIDTIAKSLIEQFDPTMRKRLVEALSRAYVRLTREDPVDVLFKMAKWVAKTFEDALKDFVSVHDDKKKGIIYERINKIVDLGFKVFNKYLSLPGEKGKGPFRVGLDFEAEKIEKRIQSGEPLDRILNELIIFKEDEVRDHLRKHVVGSAVFEKIKVIPPNSYTVVSTDASVQHIVARFALPEFMEPPRAAISAAVAAWYGVDGSAKKSTLDPYPDPRTWSQFVTEHAVREGYIIPPQMALQLDAYRWKRTVEAMMDLRHYAKDDLTMRAAIGPLPPQECYGDVYALVRDGRVFPWEHTFGDFLEPGVHGYFVRQCLLSFRRIMDLVRDFKEEIIYGGVVKWSQIEIFTRLIFWYVKYGSGLSGERLWDANDEKYDDKYIFGNVTSDQRLVKHAFSVLSKVIPTSNDERWITFRTIRRFYSLADQDDLSLKKLSEDEWEMEIENRLKDKPAHTRREIKPYISTYAHLCAKGATLSFYVQPTPTIPEGASKDIIQIPRYEILLPYDILENPEEIRKIDKAYVTRLAQIAADQRMIDIYPMRERFDIDVFLIFLKPARFAHEYVKQYAIDSKHQILGLVVQRLSQLSSQRGLEKSIA